MTRLVSLPRKNEIAKYHSIKVCAQTDWCYQIRNTKHWSNNIVTSLVEIGTSNTQNPKCKPKLIVLQINELFPLFP